MTTAGGRACVMLAAILLVTSCGTHPGPTREVVLEARGMSFVQPGATEAANPVIPMRVGERVRLILRNEAPGLLHDVAIPGWEIAVEPARAGEAREVTFIVPDEPGRHKYLCRPHAEMMHGIIEVTR